jgi:NhaA family Na+:H+ antiporter
MVVPASIYVAAATFLDRPELVRGWAIPCATDIAFSYLVARIAFPGGHAAVPFLLLLAIADDALGLIVLAVFYPTGAVAPGVLIAWLAPALLVAWVIRKLGVTHFWVYVLVPGAMSWLGLHYGGLHTALAMVPIVPFMPHEKSDLALFGNRAPQSQRTLHEFEAAWRLPVQFVLLLFGFANAGVPLASSGAATWIVAFSLIVGKPVGIVGMTMLAGLTGLHRSPDLDVRALVTLGIAAGVGFTVALFFATAAFPPGALLNEAKMGALVSFFAAPLALAASAALRRSASAR